MVKKTKTSSGNSVPVQIEKGSEKKQNAPIAQVNEEIVHGIKNAQQLYDEQQQQALENIERQRKDRFKQKTLFYAGLFGSLFLLWLGFRYFKTPAVHPAIMEELVNSSVSILPK